ncbi:MAG: type 4a pilus biogenesis protein PilO [Deltaproteobacteria bacterium]|jgi:type IV pilus assembly protein PilO|nr:type 4a pilus biogenesis protein PilO [Deltaproteobacteria bacterium]
MKKIDTSKITSLFFTTIDKIDKLSKLYKILLCLGLFALLIGPFVYFSFLPNINKIKGLKTEYSSLETRLATAKAKANQLKYYQDKLKNAEMEFKIVMKKLPEKKEIPGLLSSVSQSGRDAGLEFLLFQPEPEQNKDFYAEIPVSIKVTGNYHNVALFFDKVARLSRIVNIDDIKMTSTKGDMSLMTSCKAVTYRFVEMKPENVSSSKKKTSKP